VGLDVQRPVLGYKILLPVALALKRLHDFPFGELRLQFVQGKTNGLRNTLFGVLLDLEGPVLLLELGNRVVVPHEKELVGGEKGLDQTLPVGFVVPGVLGGDPSTFLLAGL